MWVFSWYQYNNILENSCFVGVGTGCIDKNISEPEYRVVMVVDMDCDGDGFGYPLNSLASCELQEGFVENDLDCDDQDPNIHPDAEEIPEDGIDSNCNDHDDT